MSRNWILQLVIGLALVGLANWNLYSAMPPEIGTALRQGDDPVVRYELRARLDEHEHHVHGEGTVVWRNTSSKPQSEIYLHLYLNAFRDDKSVFMREGKEIDGFRGEGVPDHWGGIDIEHVRAMGVDLWARSDKHTPGDPDDATDIRLPLPAPVAPDQSITIELAWVARLPSVVLRTGFSGSFHMVAQWFPKLARLEPDGTWAHFPFHRLSEFYADFGTYDVTVNVPAGFVVGATGVEESRREEERTELRYLAERVHDFSFVAWDGFDELERTTADGVGLRCLYPEGLDAVAALEIDETEQALARFGESYGRYPYPTLTIVHPPREAGEAGGMEYPMLITTGGHWLAPFLGVRSIENVTVHELAHQWFYGQLGSNENRWPFLDEGLTTYASSRALEERYPRASAYDGAFEVSVWALARAGAARGWDRGPIARSAERFERGQDYGDLVYNRTATLLETLRRVYGAEKLDAALSEYADRGRFGHPTPDMLVSEIEREVGAEAARNMRAGLAEGWVDHAVVALDEGGAEVRRRGSLRFPVEIELWTGEGTSRVLFPIDEDTLTIERSGLRAVVVDPDLAVLIDHDLTNNVRQLAPSPLGPRVLGQAALVAQLLATVVAP